MFTTLSNLKALTPQPPRKPRSRIGKWLASTALDERGVAAIEFAFIAPLLIIFYLGLTEISLLIKADRNVAHATSVIGDLISQDETLELATVENYIYGALAILGVDSAEVEKVGIELYAFQVTTAAVGATPQVVEETGFVTFGPEFDNGTHYDSALIPPQILTLNSGVVVARISYTYTPQITSKYVQEKVLRDTYFLKPRRSPVITFDNKDITEANPKNRYNIDCEIAGTTVSCVPLNP